ncbi:hypothetical protein OPIT5_01680 [Opitutaceae bacterium TAV5]|nr:hypothetical protein OPIT5_01680 [Opitutaceae bacterium TAV5]
MRCTDFIGFPAGLLAVTLPAASPDPSVLSSVASGLAQGFALRRRPFPPCEEESCSTCESTGLMARMVVLVISPQAKHF